MPLLRRAVGLVISVAATPRFLAAQEVDDSGVVGISARWNFANISYAAMRAQGNESGWRIVAFIFGFPGTLLSFLVVDEGGARMYGFDIPKKPRP